MSKEYTGHNAYLNQQDGESNEAYNERMQNWERKEREKQATKIAELELMEQWAETERKRFKLKHEDKAMSDFDKGVDVAFGYFAKMLEARRYAREAILHSPLEYELKLDTDGDYKLSKRK